MPVGGFLWDWEELLALLPRQRRFVAAGRTVGYSISVSSEWIHCFLKKELFDSGSKHLKSPIQNVICNVICRAGAGPDPRNYIFSRGPGRKEKWNERDMLLLNDVC